MQLFWHMTEPGDYIVKAGTPLVQWIPSTETYLQVRHVDVVIETANADDLDNNELWSIIVERILQRTLHLSERIESKADILKLLNKNIERFN